MSNKNTFSDMPVDEFKKLGHQLVELKHVLFCLMLFMGTLKRNWKISHLLKVISLKILSAI
jgi:hypothetical protein